ncbi:hypothetical protein [Enterovibrio coralii]|uniref:hypothetical protein n=1 Tax=Enterovibrio coralii TaxID=294935 RepID=UPI000A655C41|nr:hypothetical protein [Enterovibrio coralii]
MRKSLEPKAFYQTTDCDLDAFSLYCSRTTSSNDYPLAFDVIKNVPVYQGQDIIQACMPPERIKKKWQVCFLLGPALSPSNNFTKIRLSSTA